MILDRQKFDFQGRVLIEKVKIQTPFRLEVLFQNEGCFLYISGSALTVNAPDQKVRLNSKESALLRCGRYFADWLKGEHTSESEIYAFHLHPEILKTIYQNKLPQIIIDHGRKDFIKKVIPENAISKFIENLDFYFENPIIVNEELLELKIKELILLLLIQSTNTDSIYELISGLFTQRNVSIQAVINAHLYSNFSVLQLADLCNMSLSAFKREFKKIYNDTPIHYINTKRLERAKELLLLSDQHVSTICYDLGFSDPAYFSRLFKKKFTVAPNSIR